MFTLLSACKSGAKVFSGDRAFTYVEKQMKLGPRLPESQSIKDARALFIQHFEKIGWKTTSQNFTANGQPAVNIIAETGKGDCWVVFGAHYDSRVYADQDPYPINHGQPVPGANDGASGAAVLMELANVLPKDANCRITLALFDAEDQGGINNADWIAGSTYYAQSLTEKPSAVVIVDMIGDADLNIYQERTSTPRLTNEIWAAAKELGYEQYFIPAMKFSMIDDHTPFLNAGIEAIDLIDFDYPYWHTTLDTSDKVSANSLKIVGEVLIKWLNTAYRLE